MATNRTSLYFTAQFLFGGWFLFHGLNYFLNFFPQPGGGHGLIGALITAGLFALIKILEVVVGVALLANRYVPLAIVVAVPITVVIAYLNLVLKHDTKGFMVGITILAVHGAMAWGYLDHYRAMLVFKAGDPSALPSAPTIMTGEIHAIWIVFGIAIPAAVTYASIL